MDKLTQERSLTTLVVIVISSTMKSSLPAWGLPATIRECKFNNTNVPVPIGVKAIRLLLEDLNFQGNYVPVPGLSVVHLFR
jgi:hypothetical protein